MRASGRASDRQEARLFHDAWSDDRPPDPRLRAAESEGPVAPVPSKVPSAGKIFFNKGPSMASCD